MTPDALADALWEALRSKHLAAELDEVLSRFKARYAIDAARLGYGEIWLSGATSDKTFRLDD